MKKRVSSSVFGFQHSMLGFAAHFLLVCVLFAAFSTLALAATPDYASPQVVNKPLLVFPGEQVNVPIYNGGHALWSDLSVRVADGDAYTFRGLVDGEGFVDVVVDIPLVYALEADELPVTLWYGDVLLDARSLPVEVFWPKTAAVVDVISPTGPEILFFVDAAAFDGVLGGLQVELSILDGDDVVFFDFYGPFYLSSDEQFVWRTALPDSYFPAGEYDVRATFYEGNNFLAQSSSSFVYAGNISVSYAPMLLLLLCILLLVLAYVVIDVVFHKKNFSESFADLREK